MFLINVGFKYVEHVCFMKLEKNIFFLSIGIKLGSLCRIGFVAYEFKSY